MLEHPFRPGGRGWVAGRKFLNLEVIVPISENRLQSRQEGSVGSPGGAAPQGRSVMLSRMKLARSWLPPGVDECLEKMTVPPQIIYGWAARKIGSSLPGRGGCANHRGSLWDIVVENKSGWRALPGPGKDGEYGDFSDPPEEFWLLSILPALKSAFLVRARRGSPPFTPCQTGCGLWC